MHIAQVQQRVVLVDAVEAVRHLATVLVKVQVAAVVAADAEAVVWGRVKIVV